MKQSWTAGLEPEQIKDVKGDFISSHLTRKRLTKMLNDKLEEFERASLDPKNYATPNWAYLQADLQGYKRALRLVISLLEG